MKKSACVLGLAAAAMVPASAMAQIAPGEYTLGGIQQVCSRRRLQPSPGPPIRCSINPTENEMRFSAAEGRRAGPRLPIGCFRSGSCAPARHLSSCNLIFCRLTGTARRPPRGCTMCRATFGQTGGGTLLGGQCLNFAIVPRTSPLRINVQSG